ncbi:MAG: hypothetical protein Q8L86_15360 [Vicinamibacterales bacterium]|nr:hypothetical protein [Vicinamibacterales bacterium]
MVNQITSLPHPTPVARPDRDPARERDQHARHRHPRREPAPPEPPVEPAEGGDDPPIVGSRLNVTA